MAKKGEASTERDMLMEALISQGCTVEKAQHIVRAEEARDRRLMPWGVEKDDLPRVRH